MRSRLLPGQPRGGFGAERLDILMGAPGVSAPFHHKQQATEGGALRRSPEPIGALRSPDRRRLRQSFALAAKRLIKAIAPMVPIRPIWRRVWPRIIA
jgi:hypothetical protein